MTQLSQSIICKSEFVVGEGLIYVEGLLRSDTDFQFMLGSCIGDYFKIVYAIEKWAIRGDGPEVIIGLIKECMAVVRTKCYLFG